MATVAIDRTIDVACARHDAYEKLSEVESLSRFTGIAEVEARGSDRAHIVTDLEGRREEFDIVLDKVPDERISWHTTAEPAVESRIVFEQLDEGHTRLQIHREYDPQKLAEYNMRQQDVDNLVDTRMQEIRALVEGEAD